MLQLDICLGWVFYFSRCVYTLIKLKLKNHLVRVRKTSRFGLKYPFGRHDRMIREMVGWSDGNGNVCSSVRCLAVMLAVIRPHHLHFLRWKLVNKRLRLYHVWWTANIMSWCLGWLNTIWWAFWKEFRVQWCRYHMSKKSPDSRQWLICWVELDLNCPEI